MWSRRPPSMATASGASAPGGPAGPPRRAGGEPPGDGRAGHRWPAGRPRVGPRCPGPGERPPVRAAHARGPGRRTYQVGRGACTRSPSASRAGATSARSRSSSPTRPRAASGIAVLLSSCRRWPSTQAGGPRRPRPGPRRPPGPSASAAPGCARWPLGRRWSAPPGRRRRSAAPRCPRGPRPRHAPPAGGE